MSKHISSWSEVQGEGGLMDRRLTQSGGGRMMRLSRLISAVVLFGAAALILTAGSTLRAQVRDPGVRGGAAGAGGFQSLLTTFEQESECPGQQTFMQSIGVVVPASLPANNNCAGSPYPVFVQTGGLGPAFNSNSCSSCHAQPAVGGSSPPSNPLFGVYQLSGAKNIMPLFESQTGPALVPRFPFQLN